VARTAVVVEVPEAEPAIGAHYWTQTRSGREGLGPHVTLLVPFFDSEQVPLPELRRVLGAFEPFEFALTAPRRFGTRDIVLWLAPDPPAPFVAMTEALVAAFPAYPPYEDAFEDVVPHLTVAVGRDAAALDAIERDVAGALPVAARATAATVVQHVDGRWLPQAAVPLGAG
jgi:2'-5' RNA ligase